VHWLVLRSARLDPRLLPRRSKTSISFSPDARPCSIYCWQDFTRRMAPQTPSCHYIRGDGPGGAEAHGVAGTRSLLYAHRIWTDDCTKNWFYFEGVADVSR
jgi:hypothetical protein